MIHSISEIKVVCFKCKQPMSTNIKSDKEIEAFCYPCENDAWQAGADAVNRQWQRSLK